MVPCPSDWVRRSVAVREQEGRDVGDDREVKHGNRPRDPAQLRGAPREGQNAGPDNGSDDMRDACPHGSWSKRRTEGRGEITELTSDEETNYFFSPGCHRPYQFVPPGRRRHGMNRSLAQQIAGLPSSQPWRAM